MQTLTLHRAGDMPNKPAVEPISIIIRDSIEDVSKSITPEKYKDAGLNALAHVFNYEADELARVLVETLPQAVTQRLLLRLMQRYSSHYLGPIR